MCLRASGKIGLLEGSGSRIQSRLPKQVVRAIAYRFSTLGSFSYHSVAGGRANDDDQESCSSVVVGAEIDGGRSEGAAASRGVSLELQSSAARSGLHL